MALRLFKIIAVPVFIDTDTLAEVYLNDLADGVSQQMVVPGAKWREFADGSFTDDDMERLNAVYAERHAEAQVNDLPPSV